MPDFGKELRQENGPPNLCAMDDKTERSWIWVSSETSRAAGKVSILAVFETLCCVAIYWGLVLYSGVTWHHWVIVVATPMVLMRSRISEQKGGTWFDFVYRCETLMDWAGSASDRAFKISVAIILICTLTLTIAVSAIAYILFQTAIVFTVFLTFSILIGLLISISIGVRSEMEFEQGHSVLGEVVHIFFLPVKICTVLMCAIPIRLASVLRHPMAGIFQLAANWRQRVWVTDFAEPPELVPGHRATQIWQFFPEERDSGNFIAIWLRPINRATLFLFLYAPSLIWRWAIKSTVWFYLPLLWVGRGWQVIQGRELIVWATTYSAMWLNIIGFGLAGALLFISMASLLSFGRLLTVMNSLGEAPLKYVGFAFALDWSRLIDQPWQWFYLPSWILTVVMFLFIDKHAKHVVVGGIDESEKLTQFTFWMWVGNARTVLTNIGLGVARWYFLDAVNAWDQVKMAWGTLIS